MTRVHKQNLHFLVFSRNGENLVSLQIGQRKVNRKYTPTFAGNSKNLVSANKEWTPVLDVYVPLLAPLAGAVVGLVAGLYPSWRASALEPVDALRGGT